MDKEKGIETLEAWILDVEEKLETLKAEGIFVDKQDLQFMVFLLELIPLLKDLRNAVREGS